MTFEEAKNRLDNMVESEIDENQVLLARLHARALNDNDNKSADAIELASMALMLYTDKDK